MKLGVCLQTPLSSTLSVLPRSDFWYYYLMPSNISPRATSGAPQNASNWVPHLLRLALVNCCWGSLWKKLAYVYITVAVGYLWKQGTLHIAVAIEGPFESVVSVLTHYICYCWPPWMRQDLHMTFATIVVPMKVEYLRNAFVIVAPLQSRVPAHYSCCWGTLESRVLNDDVVRKTVNLV